MEEGDDSGMGGLSRFLHRAQVPSARSVMNNMLRVEGIASIDIFCGAACLTVAFIWALLPTLGPWDVLLSPAFDVLTNGWVLLHWARTGEIRFHTWARRVRA